MSILLLRTAHTPFSNGRRCRVIGYETRTALRCDFAGLTIEEYVNAKHAFVELSRSLLYYDSEVRRCGVGRIKTSSASRHGRHSLSTNLSQFLEDML
eukprot:1011954-Pleurochrysis_carterae.AAC.1